MNLLVSSTSWTADEDFSMLLDALMSYSRETLKPQNKLPRILAIITGKGPQKSYYLEEISRLQEEDRLSNVTILTAWLDMADYAALLGCADLGVSLHTSTSGLDLPMKVVDMFGAGLPVVGWSKFASWKELVKEGENGCGFGTSAELGSLLVSLFGTDRETLSLLKKGAIREGGRRWDDEWNPIAGRILGLCE
ncbi:MAG: hypothetical protein M1825_001600 [Sarcosagium campestre]|nr:MAG: hypothetical protein M1825_001600 [Sarcosagium campestre]